MHVSYGTDARHAAGRVVAIGNPELVPDLPLANVIEETASRLNECLILAGNLHAALFGPEPADADKAPPEAAGVVWGSRRNLNGAVLLMRKLNEILHAVEKK